MFNAERHFMSKINSSSSSKLETNQLRIWLGNTPYVNSNKKKSVKEPQFPYKYITKEVANNLHRLFAAFIEKVKKENINSSIINILYRMELVGVLIAPISHKEKNMQSETFKKGILINETKNTLVIAFDGAVKIYPKAMYNFIIFIENSKYFIIGPGLKVERRYGK